MMIRKGFEIMFVVTVICIVIFVVGFFINDVSGVIM
jgi:hypothetical protein